MCISGNSCSTIQTHPRYHGIAHSEYDKALRQSFWTGVRTRVQGKANQLISYAEARRHIQTSSHRILGVQDIEIDSIIGSSGRFRNFDISYMPVTRMDDDRWVNIAQAHLEGVQLPPVNLYKIDDDYYVEDGNHRVSVARVMNQQFIRAQVIEIESISYGSDAAD